MSLGAPELHPVAAVPARPEAPEPGNYVARAAITGFFGNALRQLVRRAKTDRHAPLAFITVPAPCAPVDTLPLAFGETPAYSVLWDPPTGPSFAGVGCAVDITATGQGRITQIAERAEAVWARLEHTCMPGSDPVTPRFFGGFAFTEGAAAREPWMNYGDARFILPRWLYTRDGDRARLSLTVDMAVLAGAGRGDSGPSETAITRAILDRTAQLDRLLERLAARGQVTDRSFGQVTDESERPAVVAVSDTEPEAWRRQIEDIRAAIAARKCDKIVAARCRVLELSRDIEPARVLTTLARSYPDCYRFAYRFARDSVFVGATPERLITHAGERISTQALAGSIAADSGDRQRAADALLASSKDRSEQDFVVQTIRSVLGPLCSELRVPDAPEIRELRHVLHLETPISGTLARPVHVLELVAALHPTPAVGGVPTRLATEWIAEREPMARGWYAAPVGWFDGRGQGEFAVAIRSGLLRERTAFIYAGAGIVRDSDPDAEFAETRLKQRPITSALGIAP